MPSLIMAQRDIKPNIIEIGKYYPAKVVENNDLKKHKDKKPRGRVQFRIPVLFDDIDDELLPWAIPLQPRFNGGKESGAFSVPEKEVEILVQFLTPDVYNPVYCGYPYTLKEQLEFLYTEQVDKDEYPKKHLLYSLSKKSYMWVNADYGDDKLKWKLFWENEGNVEINFKKNHDITVAKDYFQNIKGKYEEVITTSGSNSGYQNPNGDNTRSTKDLLDRFHRALRDTTNLFEGRLIQTMRGSAFSTFENFCSAQFAKGKMQEVRGAYLLRISGGDLMVVANNIKMVAEGNVEISARNNLTLLAGANVYLNGSEIYKSTELKDGAGGVQGRREIDQAVDMYKAMSDPNYQPPEQSGGVLDLREREEE